MTSRDRSHKDIDKLQEAIVAQLSQTQRGCRRVPYDGSAVGNDTAAARAVYRQMQRIAELVVHSGCYTTQRSSDSIFLDLSAVTQLCDQKFVTYNYDNIPSIWRAIYIDAQLIRALHVLKALGIHLKVAHLERCIRNLDLALIVAGAASTSKGQLCHDLIIRLQSMLSELEQYNSHKPESYDNDCSPPRKRFRTAKVECWSPGLSETIQADSLIREFAFGEAPSFMDLAAPDTSVRLTPFIVRAYAQEAGWSAVQSSMNKSAPGSWSSMEHLLQMAGPGRVVPVEVGANYIRKDWGQDVMLWSDFLRHCRWDETEQVSGARGDQISNALSPRQPLIYMAQHDLTSQFPALERDYMLPDYVYTSPSPCKECPIYAPPATSNGVITNLWIGPAGTVSPPHYDPFYNCFVQAVGFKEVWVAPPHCRPSNEMTGSHSRRYGDSTTIEPEASSGTDTTTCITEALMQNTADIDVFETLEAVPPFVRAAASKAILGPGDLLYMPPGWWHSLRSMTRSFSVSTWF